MIGAGPAGLSAARHLRTFGIQVVDKFNYGQYGVGGGGRLCPKGVLFLASGI